MLDIRNANVKLSMHQLGINRDSIIHDLSNYYKSFTKRQEAIILKKFTSIEDYINILYWLKFVKNYDYNEMSAILHMNLSNVYMQFYPIGWGYTGSFEDNIAQHKKVLEELNTLKKEIYTIELSDIIKKVGKDKEFEIKQEIKDIYEKISNIGLKNQSFLSLGFISLQQYVYAFFYLIRIKNLTVGEIALLFNCSRKNINYKLKQLGLNRSHDEAQKNIKQRRRRDTSRIMRSGRNTTLKKVIEKGSFGSYIENVIRSKFELILPYYFNTEVFDIIVGVNTKNIISPKEVDIPIVLYNTDSRKTYRFAIEVNGNHVHNEDDKLKIDKIVNRGWKYYSVWVMSSTKEQNDVGQINKQIENICREMAVSVKKSDFSHYTK